MKASRIVIALAVALTPVVGFSAQAVPARQAILDGYAAEAKMADPAFSGFDAKRGESFFRARHGSGKPDTPACTSCHGDNPAVSGQNARTGKPIDPMAVAANPRRFTDSGDVEKWFGRNCKEVLGRACTAKEKGDFLVFLSNL